MAVLLSLQCQEYCFPLYNTLGTIEVKFYYNGLVVITEFVLFREAKFIVSFVGSVLQVKLYCV